MHHTIYPWSRVSTEPLRGTICEAFQGWAMFGMTNEFHHAVNSYL